MYLISLYFDEKTNNIIRNHMKQVAAKSGNDYMISGNVPPHITVAGFTCDDRDNEIIIRKLAGSYRELPKGKITWAGVGTFLPSVIYITPILNDYLDKISKSVYNGLNDLKKRNNSFGDSLLEIHSKYVPLNWIPHTTIGKKLSSEEMLDAFMVIKDRFGVFTGEVVKIGIARTNPYEDIIVLDLQE